jgi:arylsulfate sulfotransferase
LSIVGALSGCRLFYQTVPVNGADVSVMVNPYGNAPLSALVIVASTAGIDPSLVSSMKVAVPNRDGSEMIGVLLPHDPDYPEAFGTSDLGSIPAGATVIPILGLYPDETNHVVAYLYDDAEGKMYVVSADITTSFAGDTSDTYRDGYPSVEFTHPAASRPAGMTLVSLYMGAGAAHVTRPFAFDHDGVIRWALRLDGIGDQALPDERLANGTLVLGAGTHLYAYNMLGRQVHDWNLGGYGYSQHHDAAEITEGPHAGDLLVPVDKIGLTTKEDFIIELGRDGTLVQAWDLRQVLDVSRMNLVNNTSDWLHVNAVTYDPADDSLIVSGRSQGIFKVDRSNHLKWIVAPHQGWGAAGPAGEGADTSAYLLTAVSPSGTPYAPDVQEGRAGVDDALTFDWPWGQHAVLLRSPGDLLVFDNGFNRHFSGSDLFSRAVEYRVDEARMTVSQEWQYGRGRGSDFYSFIVGDVDMAAGTGIVVVSPGAVYNSGEPAHAYVTEVTYPGGAVASEARIVFRNTYPGQIDLDYRAEQLTLYP